MSIKTLAIWRASSSRAAMAQGQGAQKLQRVLCKTEAGYSLRLEHGRRPDRADGGQCREQGVGVRGMRPKLRCDRDDSEPSAAARSQPSIRRGWQACLDGELGHAVQRSQGSERRSAGKLGSPERRKTGSRSLRRCAPHGKCLRRDDIGQPSAPQRCHRPALAHRRG